MYCNTHHSIFKGLELVLSQGAVQVDDHVTVVCEEELEGGAMVTTMEELFSPSFPAGSAVSKAYKWLLVNLQSLPHFETVQSTCCFALRQVTLFVAVSMYFNLVSEFCHVFLYVILRLSLTGSCRLRILVCDWHLSLQVAGFIIFVKFGQISKTGVMHPAL